MCALMSCHFLWMLQHDSAFMHSAFVNILNSDAYRNILFGECKVNLIVGSCDWYFAVGPQTLFMFFLCNCLHWCQAPSILSWFFQSFTNKLQLLVREDTIFHLTQLSWRYIGQIYIHVDLNMAYAPLIILDAMNIDQLFV